MNVTTLWYWAQNAAKTKKAGCNCCRCKRYDCKNYRATEMIAEIPILQYHLK